jgi:hypothetical protein
VSKVLSGVLQVGSWNGPAAGNSRRTAHAKETGKAAQGAAAAAHGGSTGTVGVFLALPLSPSIFLLLVIEGMPAAATQGLLYLDTGLKP